MLTVSSFDIHPSRYSKVEVVDKLVNFGSKSTALLAAETTILRRIGVARTYINSLEKRTWKSSVRLDTKI